MDLDGRIRAALPAGYCSLVFRSAGALRRRAGSGPATVTRRWCSFLHYFGRVLIVETAASYGVSDRTGSSPQRKNFARNETFQCVPKRKCVNIAT